MPLNPDQVFINRVKRIFGVGDGRRKQFEEQQRVLDDVLGGLTDDVKQSIKDGMTFKLKSRRLLGRGGKAMSKGGQLEELDPEEAMVKFKALSPEDRKKSQEAMDKLMIGYFQKLRDAKDKDGNHLFGDPFAERNLEERLKREGEPTDEEGKARLVKDREKAREDQERARKLISQELFEPLVREGVIPEWVVPKEFSKTQRYLDATYQRYKETLEEQRKAKISGKVKTDVDFHGAGSKTDQVKAFFGKLSSIPDNILDSVSVGTHEERSRALGLTTSTASFAMSTVEAISSVEGLIDGVSLKEAQDSMDYGKALESTTFAKIGDKLKDIGLSSDQVVEVLAKLDEAKANGTLDLITEPISGSEELIVGVIETILVGKEIGDKDKILKAIGKGTAEARIEREAMKLIPQIDGALEAALAKVSEVAGAAVKGAFESAVSAGPLVRLLTGQSPDTKGFVEGLADGLEDAIANCMPGDEVFESVAGKVKAAFLTRAKPEALANTLDNERTVGKAFEAVFKAAKGAIAQATAISSKGDDDEPPDQAFAGTAAEFKRRLAQPDVQKGILKNVTAKQLAPPDEIEEQSEEELLEYEAALTLVDEGGELGAMTQTIDKLIADLEKGQKIVDMVNKLGGTILGSASSGVGIAQAAVDHATGVVTKAGDILGNEVVPILKAAKLILRFSLQIKLMADRLRLWNSFRVQVGRSQKAGSPLSPAIKGFYNNKKEQVTFHGIEMAMVTVQIAGAVCESVHEPHVMAVGKAVSAIGTAGEAGNALAMSIYDEVQLRRGWATTKAALNNPANRKLGLKALMINPTLATHAIAWAAKVERDVTARDFLKGCGLSESTLDVGASEEKIREYMTTLLYEDRKFLDFEKIRTNWQPPNIELTKANWVITCARGKTKATPPLGDDQPSGIGAGLGELDAAAGYLKPLLAADAGKLAELLAPTPKVDHVAKLTRLQATALKLNKDLDGYSPKAKDGTDHEDMQMLVLRYQSMAEDMEIRLTVLVNEAKAQVASVVTT
jgi:hypothetical protein